MAQSPSRDAASRAKKRDVRRGGMELFSSKYTATGTAISTTPTTVEWPAPSPDTGSWSYSSGIWTVPSGLDGYYVEWNVNLGVTSPAGDGIELQVSLQANTGSGYVEVAAKHGYVTANTGTLDEGGVSIAGYVDASTMSTDDKWRVQVSYSGKSCEIDPDQSYVSVKVYPA